MSAYGAFHATEVRDGAAPRMDPRARRVVEINRRGRRLCIVQLECGHETRRKLFSCSDPKYLICTECPPCGGIGDRLGCQ